jgi:hypothetical protein
MKRRAFLTAFAGTAAWPLVAHAQQSDKIWRIGAVDWRFAPKWDAYFGMMCNQVNGGLAYGFLAHNNIDPTVGVRFKF